jgi:oxaloacetate decarboxylase (Na+ extruding) subunit gamma
METALLLLAVGMITVFAVLSLVVITGQALIRVVNFFAGEASPPPGIAGGGPDKSRIAAIVAIVDALTGGKGKVGKIE